MMMTVSKPPTEKTKKIGGTLADEDLEPYEGYYCYDLCSFVTKFDAAVALFWRPRDAVAGGGGFFIRTALTALTAVGRPQGKIL